MLINHSLNVSSVHGFLRRNIIPTGRCKTVKKKRRNIPEGKTMKYFQVIPNMDLAAVTVMGVKKAAR
jgi:hypothetical protein